MKVGFARLLAKSWSNTGRIPDSALLPQHLIDVFCATCAVMESSGDDQLRALGLSPDRWRGRFARIIRVAAAVHDLGKANDHFQGIVRRTRQQPQGLRHEWVAYWILRQTALCEWIASVFESRVDWHITLWSVTGHHPGYHHPTPPSLVEGGGSEINLLHEHNDFVRCLDWLAQEFRLDTPPRLRNIKLPLTGSDNAFKMIRCRLRDDEAMWNGLGDSEQRLVAACKACLIGADVAGSALAGHLSHSAACTQWISEALKTYPQPEQLEGLVRERLKGKAERPFQQEVAEADNRVTLIRAGCGTGKTVAAYLRAARKWPGKRLYFCYPTTGTATEGFRGYLFSPEEGRSKYHAQLFHSRAATDLEMILHVQGDEDPNDERLRVESLLAWSTPIVCCTVDTVFALLQNQRRGLFAWPALAQSAFVFDEIHAYDDKLFGELLCFIRSLQGVPILLMTASLPAPRHQAIQACLQRNGEGLGEIPGPRELESLPRYRRLTGTAPEALVRREFDCGGKVLWVCNTVGRAMEAARRLEEFEPHIYHSRFRYEDRVKRHTDVVDAFRFDRVGHPALAICTQVAEMSLDLSATLIVTDLAPVPSLIQRLGRLNRWAVPPESDGPPRTMPFVVIEPRHDDGSFMTSPYDRRDYGDWPAAARDWLDKLGDQNISQSDLAAAWQDLDTGQVPRPVASTWLDGGPRTMVDAVRDASDGITVIMEGEDAEDVRSGRKPSTQVALPMPPPHGTRWRGWRRVKGYLVVSAGFIHYDPKRGASWHES